MNMKTCIVIFHEPLYTKSRYITYVVCLSEIFFIFVRLGSFHKLMLYMKSTCYIIGGIGIKEADAVLGFFQRVYLQIQSWLEREISTEEGGWKY